MEEKDSTSFTVSFCIKSYSMTILSLGGIMNCLLWLTWNLWVVRSSSTFSRLTLLHNTPHSITTPLQQHSLLQPYGFLKVPGTFHCSFLQNNINKCHSLYLKSQSFPHTHFYILTQVLGLRKRLLQIPWISSFSMEHTADLQ